MKKLKNWYRTEIIYTQYSEKLMLSIENSVFYYSSNPLKTINAAKRYLKKIRVNGVVVRLSYMSVD